MLRPTQVRQHVNFMHARGFSTDDVLKGTGIDPSRLGEPRYLVEIEQCHGVVRNMMQLTGNGSIGLEIGACTNVQDLGIVGYAMASADSLGQAIGLWLQYGNTPMGFPFVLEIIESPDGGQWGVRASSNGIGGAVYRFYIEQTLAMGLSFGELLTGERLEVSEVACSFPAPPHSREYERRFNCAITFDAPVTQAWIKAPSLNTPVKNNDSELRELCVQHCSHLSKHTSPIGPISFRLRSTLMAIGRIPTLQDAADALKMSSRSLRRHLQDENTSFQRALDAFRCDLAKEYLSTGMMPAKEVAYLLGFSQVDTFRRAFKNWTGTNVRAFQLSVAIRGADGRTKAHLMSRIVEGLNDV